MLPNRKGQYNKPEQIYFIPSILSNDYVKPFSFRNIHEDLNITITRNPLTMNTINNDNYDSFNVSLFP